MQFGITGGIPTTVDGRGEDFRGEITRRLSSATLAGTGELVLPRLCTGTIRSRGNHESFELSLADSVDG